MRGGGGIAKGGRGGATVTIRIRDIDHVVLRVSDLDRMLEFYSGFGVGPP